MLQDMEMYENDLYGPTLDIFQIYYAHVTPLLEICFIISNEDV